MDPYNLDSKVTVKPLQNGHLFITIIFLGSVKRYKTNPNLRKKRSSWNKLRKKRYGKIFTGKNHVYRKINR